MRMYDSLRRCTTPILVGCAIAVAPTLAVGLDNEPTPGVTPTTTQKEANENSAAAEQSERMESRKLIEKATDVVQRMRSDPKVAELLRSAKGVYIVPDFTRAALGVGGEGGDVAGAGLVPVGPQPQRPKQKPKPKLKPKHPPKPKLRLHPKRPQRHRLNPKPPRPMRNPRRKPQKPPPLLQPPRLSPTAIPSLAANPIAIAIYLH